MMKENKIFKIFLVLIILLLLASCKKSETPQTPQQPSLAKQIESVKETAKNIIKTSNETIQQPQEQEQPSQTVYVPIETTNVITQNDIRPCLLAKYSGLNLWCSFVNFWHNQSTLLSWYIPYSIILFIAFVLFIAIIIWLLRSK